MMKSLFKLIVTVLLLVGVASGHAHSQEVYSKPRIDSVYICESSAATLTIFVFVKGYTNVHYSLKKRKNELLKGKS